jgi:hypothetical protein
MTIINDAVGGNAGPLGITVVAAVSFLVLGCARQETETTMESIRLQRGATERESRAGLENGSAYQKTSKEGWILETCMDETRFTRGEQIALLLEITSKGKDENARPDLRIKLRTTRLSDKKLIADVSLHSTLYLLDRERKTIKLPDDGLWSVPPEKDPGKTSWVARVRDVLDREFTADRNIHLDYGKYSLEIEALIDEKIEFGKNEVVFTITKDVEKH